MKTKNPLLVSQYQQVRLKQSGVSLVELMVALAIGLLVSLAVSSVLSLNEVQKRKTTSVNDIDQSGVYVSYQLDKALRSAGSGFAGGLNPNAATTTSTSQYSFGCVLKAYYQGTPVLPSPGGFPEPFTAVNGALVLAPVIIFDGAAPDDDVLLTMGGSGGLSESVTNLIDTPTNNLINVSTTASMSANDKILLVAANSGAKPSTGSTCLIDQAASSFIAGAERTDVSVGGDYHGTDNTIATYNTDSLALNLGKSPNFAMFGVGRNNTLFKYDLLKPAAPNASDPNPSELTDGIFAMKAIYGIGDINGNVTWQRPTGAYAAAALMSRTPAAADALRSITLVRLALIMRTAFREQTGVSDTSITLFDNTGVPTTVINLDPNYRYRVVETTIPVRNTLAALAR